MGTPLQSILNGGIGQERNSGENRKSASIAAEPVKFNIISVFEDGTGKVDFKPENIRQLTEGKLLQLFPQNPADDLEIPFLSQTEEWHRSLEKKELLAPKPPGTTATLNIIYVNNDEDFFHGMSPDTLPKLFKIFWLDISALHLLGRSVDTWHCIRRDEICNFLFIIQGLYRIACSFSPKGRETNCVVFGVPPKRVVDGLGNFNFYFYRPAWFCEQSPSSHERRDNQSMLDKQITFEPSRAFPDLLANIESYHLHHPLSLACFGLLDSLVSISLRVGDEIGPTTDLENKVTAPIGEDEKTLNSLVSLSKKAGRASVTMARLSRVTGVASMLLQTLQDRKGWKRWCRGFFPTSSGSQYDRAAEWLAENLPSRSQWLQNEKLQIQSQDERVKALTPILFALISRADAQSGLTIAVMTMTFLPATSIAAIMAVPWDRGGQRVQTLQAIVYCVVTFFMTVAVFLIWMRGITWFRRGAMWFTRDETGSMRVATLFKSEVTRLRKAKRRAADV